MANFRYSNLPASLLTDGDCDYSADGGGEPHHPSVPSMPDVLGQSVSEFRIWPEMTTEGQGIDPLAYDQLPVRMFPPSTLGTSKDLIMGKKTGRQLSDVLVASSKLFVNGLQKPEKEYLSVMNKDAAPTTRQRLSAEEIMRVAGMRFIQSKGLGDNDNSSPMHTFGSELSAEDTKDVELSQILMSAAEKVGEQQFDHAKRLLFLCELSSKGKTPAQRIVLSFAEALGERIDKMTGKYDPEMQEPRTRQCLSVNLTLLTCHRLLPFTQITQFTSAQVLVENTATANRIHVINLAIRSGIQMIVLMKALHDRKSCALEHLKVTAVAIEDRETVEESGRILGNAAISMGLNFSFRVIYPPDFCDVRKDQFDIEDGETVAVYAPMVLETMISRQSSLERLMMVIRNLNPSVMIVTEVQANHNSPSFLKRFTEVLFFYSTFIDCLETCSANDGSNNMISEQCLFSGVRNMLSSEGHERTSRNVKIDVWRAFFSRNGLVEIGLSEDCLYQATLVSKQFPWASFCTIEYDGKCLLVGWRGTPLFSVSAWKFR
ncbi:hypothetical protein MLD38_028162 [Melastoma candidum]|uniref:Uncharacterized protein n=1 Tax=Melastoma candidum TaxID=119954 RepID=A0ACB9MZZ1_9MYRT|nr:hypothetical protein MLD38_028162 [Melastoma candidum]